MWPQLAMMAAMAALNKFTSKPDKMKQVPTMTKGQQGLLNQLTGMLGSQGAAGIGGGMGTQYLMDLLNPQSQAYQDMEKPYMQQFEQQTVPGLAERFSGLGAMGGGLSSSGFGQALSSAGGNLQTNLAALRQSGMQNAAQGLMGNYRGLLGMGLGAQPFSNMYLQGGASPFGPAISSMAQGFGQKMGSPGFGGQFQDWLVNNMPGGIS